MAFEIERRISPRLAVTWPIVVITAREVIRGETKDISLGGAFIHGLTHLGEDESFSLAIITPLDETALLVTAEIVWSNISNCDDHVTSCGMGVRFSKLSYDDEQLLSRVIEEHLKGID